MTLESNFKSLFFQAPKKSKVNKRPNCEKTLKGREKSRVNGHLRHCNWMKPFLKRMKRVAMLAGSTIPEGARGK